MGFNAVTYTLDIMMEYAVALDGLFVLLIDPYTVLRSQAFGTVPKLCMRNISSILLLFIIIST